MSDVDRLHATEVVGLSYRQEGQYQSVRGLAGILGGTLVGPVLDRLGSGGFTGLSNMATAGFFLMMAGARGRPGLYLAALIPYIVGGTSRGAAVSAMHTEAGLACGYTAGGLAADLGNAKAVVNAIAPWLFTLLYSGSHGFRGLPYVVAAATAAASQLVFSCLPKRKGSGGGGGEHNQK